MLTQRPPGGSPRGWRSPHASKASTSRMRRRGGWGGLGASRRPGGRTAGSPHRGRARQRWMRAGCSSAARSRTRHRPRPRWEPGGPPTVQLRFAELAWFARSTSDRVCGCSRSRPSMPRIPRRSRWSVVCARTRAPAPMRRCGWLSIGWRSRLRWTPPPRRCSCRRWPCCSRAGPEEVVAKAARKATFRLASALANLSAARGGCHHPVASSSLMRLRLRLCVARTDAR